MIPLARCSQWVVPVLSVVARTRSSMHPWIARVVRDDHGLRGPARVEVDDERSGGRWETGTLRKDTTLHLRRCQDQDFCYSNLE